MTDMALFWLGLCVGLIVGLELARRAYRDCANQLRSAIEVYDAALSQSGEN